MHPHKYQIFPLCLASVVCHHNYCLFSFWPHLHPLLWMRFLTSLLLPRALYYCFGSSALFCSHWRGVHNKPTENLLEPSTKKSSGKAAIPNLTFHVFSCTLFFFQTTPQTEKFSCANVCVFNQPLFFPQAQAIRTICISSHHNAGLKADSVLFCSLYMGAASWVHCFPSQRKN